MTNSAVTLPKNVMRQTFWMIYDMKVQAHKIITATKKDAFGISVVAGLNRRPKKWDRDLMLLEPIMLPPVMALGIQVVWSNMYENSLWMKNVSSAITTCAFCAKIKYT